MRNLKKICKNSIPYISLAGATMAKAFALVLFPLNLTILILNLAMLFTMINIRN